MQQALGTGASLRSFPVTAPENNRREMQVDQFCVHDGFREIYTSHIALEYGSLLLHKFKFRNMFSLIVCYPGTTRVTQGATIGSRSGLFC